MRISFTIIFNGLHHLRHNNWLENILKNFDLSVFVDGLALPGGSTCWCKPVADNMHKNGASIDGTVEFLSERTGSGHKAVLVESVGPWKSKDDMVNAAIGEIRDRVSDGYLWEVDVDEQWYDGDLKAAETSLDYVSAQCGSFLCNYYVGKDRIAVGEWGEGRLLPYRRLWKWRGQQFKTHEPPELVGWNGATVLLPQRFNHYAYYFEKDVLFKQEYYGQKSLLENWTKIVKSTEKVLPITALLSTGMWSKTNTSLIKV